MKKKLQIGIGITVMVLVLAAAAALTLRSTPLSVRVKVLAPEDVTYTFKEEGLVTATREGTLVSAGAGPVAKVLASEGQRVGQGEILLEIDASMLLLQVEEAGAVAQSHRQQVSLQEAAIRQAEDERASAQAEWERQEELFQAGAIPQVDLEGAEQSLRQAEAALATAQETKAYQESMAQSAEAKVKQLQLDVSRCQIRAPYNALVEEVLVKAGDNLAPQSPLLKLYDPASLLVESYVRQEDAAALAVGDDVSLVLAGNAQDTSYAGKIAAISPYAVERISALGVSERRLEIQVQPEEGAPLGNGFSIDVSYIAAQETACLAVPKEAIFPYDDGSAVWLAVGGVAKVAPVEQGLKTEREIVITAGLQEGDAVIMNAPDTLREGDEVQIEGSLR